MVKNKLLSALLAAFFILFTNFPVYSQTPALPETIKKVQATVVDVKTDRRYQSRSRAFDDFTSRFFKDFFETGQTHREQIICRSEGAGVVIGAEGLVLTNAHVVSDAENIQIILHDQKPFFARILGKNQKEDLALLQIVNDQQQQLKYLSYSVADSLITPLADKVKLSFETIPMGNSDEIQVGQDVFAIGNPFGYRKTVTKGIVSAIHREFKIGNEILFEDLIQTDTSVNPGNSGGPLIDMKGEMIGLIHAREWRAQGIGFAIPVNRIKTLIPEMKAGKDQDIQTETFQKRFGFFPKNCKSTNAGDPEQVMVSEISLGSALQKAGVRVGDLIRQFQKKQIRSAKQLVEEAETIKPGERVYLEIERQGRTLFTYFEVKS